MTSVLMRPVTRGGQTRRPPRGRRVAKLLAYLMILAGTLAVLDAGVTLVWQEPISALYAKLRQDHLSGALRQIERAAPSPLEKQTLASLGDENRRIAYLAGELERHTRNGSAVGRIVMPLIGASFVMVKGTGTSELESGPGVFPQTGLPGISQTIAVAGHRTTYQAPFRHIDALRRGSRILVEMPYARFTYTVTGERVVAPTDVQAATGKVGYSRIVLSACTPLFSAAKRLLVFARLSRIEPEGAARSLPGGAVARPIDAREAKRAPVRPALPAMLESLDPQTVATLA